MMIKMDLGSCDDDGGECGDDGVSAVVVYPHPRPTVVLQSQLRLN